jgi:hypothetical protein
VTLSYRSVLRTSLNPRFIARIRSLLAGGYTIEEDTYLVDLLFDGRLITAEATFCQAQDILIGTHLLQQYRLEVNFADDTVLLERVSA